jgi:glutamate-ammonia-ligase adenylyltransferase
VAQRFAAIRAAVLAQARPASAVVSEVRAMRDRMRAELDRSTDASFDLKQGEGGLVDLEFLLQARVLRDAATQPALLERRNTAELIAAIGAAEAAWPASALLQAHAALVASGLQCSLDGRPRLVATSEALAQARASVRTAYQAFFGS